MLQPLAVILSPLKYMKLNYNGNSNHARQISASAVTKYMSINLKTNEIYTHKI
jgi:hypothetical protein